MLEVLKNFWNRQLNRQFICELCLQIVVIIAIIIIQVNANPNDIWAIPSEIIFSLFSVVGSISIGLHFENKKNKAYFRKKISSCVMVLSGALLTVLSLLCYVLGKVMPAQGVNIMLVICLVLDFIYYGFSFYIRKAINEKQETNELKGGAY